MNEKEYLDCIFGKYVQTRELLEFKEEIYSNLKESILQNKKNGLSNEEAFQKAKDELGDLSQLLKQYPLQENKVEMWLYWVSIAAIIFGLSSAFITYCQFKGEYGVYLAFGSLYPFCVAEVAYILWYKLGHAKRTVCNIAMGLSCCVFLFFLLNVIEGKLWWTQFSVATELVYTVLGLGGTIYFYIRGRKSK